MNNQQFSIQTQISTWAEKTWKNLFFIFFISCSKDFRKKAKLL